MKTLVTESVEIASEIVRNGGIVAFPTETVYGLGAPFSDTEAIKKVFDAKRRPQDNPLIVHISTPEQIEQVASEITLSAATLIAEFFPGPLTIVLPKSGAVPELVTAGLETVAVRMPANEIAIALIEGSRTPLVAPSANVSGKPSPTTAAAVIEDLGGIIDCVLDGGQTRHGLESTVVDCTGETPVLLRSGSLSIEDLRTVCPDIKKLEPSSDLSRRSPGLRHRHYSPEAAVLAVNTPDPSPPPNTAFIGFMTAGEGYDFVVPVETKEEYAVRLFEFLRECDRRGIQLVHCEAVDEAGIGSAIMDRIRRAAAD